MTQRKNYNNLSHIPQYPELSCYAKKKTKKHFCVGVFMIMLLFSYTIVCFDTTKRSVHSLTGGMMSHPPTAI